MNYYTVKKGNVKSKQLESTIRGGKKRKKNI